MNVIPQSPPLAVNVEVFDQETGKRGDRYSSLVVAWRLDPDDDSALEPFVFIPGGAVLLAATERVWYEVTPVTA